MVAVQVPKVEGVEWAEPYEMGLEYSFCSSSATPTIKRLGHKLYSITKKKLKEKKTSELFY